MNRRPRPPRPTKAPKRRRPLLPASLAPRPEVPAVLGTVPGPGAGAGDRFVHIYNNKHKNYLRVGGEDEEVGTTRKEDKFGKGGKQGVPC